MHDMSCQVRAENSYQYQRRPAGRRRGPAGDHPAPLKRTCHLDALGLLHISLQFTPGTGFAGTITFPA